MPPRKIRVLIADDHGIVRSGLKMLIDTQTDMEVVSEAADGKQAVRAARESKPDVVLLDLTMPGTGGSNALKEIIRTGPKTRVIILTMHEDIAYLRWALTAGATGYVLKRAVDVELLSAIRAVNRGGIFVDPSLAAGVLQKQDANGRRATPRNLLSDRELQVLRFVAQGYSSQEIAERLFVSVKTVETYRQRIADKLEIRTRSDLVRFAIQTGLLTSETLQVS